MLCIPITASEEDLERTGIVVEAMAAESWKTVFPAYYEHVLGTKLIRDQETREMLDILYDGIVYDFGYIFDNWNGCTWLLLNMVQSNSKDVTSYWKGKEKLVNENYKKLFEAIGD